MTEEWMKSLCLDTVDGVAPYPDVELAELRPGDVVYITLAPKPDGQEEADNTPVQYTFPGTVVDNEGKTLVQLFESGLWERMALTQVEEVEAEEALHLRSGTKRLPPTEADEKEPPEDDDTIIADLWTDPVDTVVADARNKLMDRDKQGFGKYMIEEVDKKKELNEAKWSLIKTICETMTKQLTVAGLRDASPIDGDKPTTDEARAFKTTYIDPSVAALASSNPSKAPAGQPKAHTLMKYCCKMMWIVATDTGVQATEASGEVDTTRLEAKLAKLETSFTKLLNDKFALLNAQLQLSGTTGGARALAASTELGGDAEAMVLKVLGNGDCAYTVMDAGRAKSQDANAKLDLSRESSTRMGKMARKVVCLEANREWAKDKELFESTYAPYEEFMSGVLAEKRTSDTWPEFCQWRFYANANKGRLEYRIKQLVEKDGTTRVQNYSTKIQDAGQPEFVMFPVFRNGHYDIASVSVDGEPVYVFPADKAEAAEKLIDALLLKTPRRVHFAEELDEKELNQLLDGALGLAADAPGEEDFNVVLKRSDKKKKRKAAAELKATAQAQAAAEARMAKIAAEAATKVLRQGGGGTWAMAVGKARTVPGWVHQSGAGSPGLAAQGPNQRTGAADQTGHVPAVVVFGEGSKKTLKKAIKAVDPTAAAAISSVYKIDVGAPRSVVHCTEEDLQVVLAIIPGLRADGFHCAAYEERRGEGRKRNDGAPPKAKQAERGLREASQRAGVCHYMAAGRECPHSQQGQCKFVCYDQQQRTQPNARRRQPQGWRR
jgi:hypothetical protein